jgi:menaquinone-dependent protoporphyrinogen oxidase
MTVLVGYSSKYGATQGIAERIAGRLRDSGLDVQTLPLASVGDLAGYDAFVIGSSAYMGSWLREARTFVRRHHDALAAAPVWLFSSGPLGTATTDAQGRDVLTEAEPRQFAEYRETLRPRALQVFFGALDPARLRRRDRLVMRIPALRPLMPEGDFRDWPAIDAWTDDIARELAPQPS